SESSVAETNSPVSCSFESSWRRTRSPGSREEICAAVWVVQSRTSSEVMRAVIRMAGLLEGGKGGAKPLARNVDRIIGAAPVRRKCQDDCGASRRRRDAPLQREQ